ncbi:hypothetical protein CPB83DRAFT_845430 [Crepidotus variabilis]|uniref:F-box domain-containing protein n=1 Tax=Crepidotus variabilis TaxID=179855 RepID=A0A9P6EPF2_9AGAR|nr:hypothetical protein CPB83DRAFT_845430 [Crepidotus variabilis]
MTVELPPEIIDLIVDALPYDKLIWSMKSSLAQDHAHAEQAEDLRSCTYVSRSFSNAARRRLFSTLILEEPTHTRGEPEPKDVVQMLTTLLELLEDAGFLGVIKTLKLNVDSSEPGVWVWHCRPSADKLLGRIFTAMNTSISNLSHICLEGPTYTPLDWSIGTSTQQALLQVLPRVRQLSIKSLRAPAFLFEHSPLLESLNLIHVPVGLERNSQEAESQSFLNVLPLPSHLRELVIRMNLRLFSKMYQGRGQSLPACTRIRLEYRKEDTLVVGKLLEGSKEVLESLIIVHLFTRHSERDALLGVQLKLEDFHKLSTIKFVVHGTKSSQNDNLLCFVKTTIMSFLDSLESAMLPAHLQQLDFLFPYTGTIYMRQETQANATYITQESTRHSTLLEKLPYLKSIMIIVDASGQKIWREPSKDSDENDSKRILEANLSAIVDALFGIHHRSDILLSPSIDARVAWDIPSDFDLYRAERQATQ